MEIHQESTYIQICRSNSRLSQRETRAEGFGPRCARQVGRDSDLVPEQGTTGTLRAAQRPAGDEAEPAWGSPAGPSDKGRSPRKKQGTAETLSISVGHGVGELKWKRITVTNSPSDVTVMRVFILGHFCISLGVPTIRQDNLSWTPCGVTPGQWRSRGNGATKHQAVQLAGVPTHQPLPSEPHNTGGQLHGGDKGRRTEI